MEFPIVVFAQVPPPEHGQSRMVQRTLDALKDAEYGFEVHHVNARFSETLGDVGESSLGKLALSVRYLFRVIRLRLRLNKPLLLYVPGPANWSPVLRDWLLLAVLRLFYRRIVFHWHAIGHGEWAHGSKRLKLDGPKWVDSLARAVSRQLLEEPFASISVSDTSCKDAAAVASRHTLIVPNGIEDPCPDYDVAVEPVRLARLHELRAAAQPCFRILFLSHGTVEKGIIDAADALRHLLATCDPKWRFHVTFAGGLSEAVEAMFNQNVAEILEYGGDRITIETSGYVTGEEKKNCYLGHDIFLSPSRWESFGLTVLEAMAFGMRIVAAASDGVKGVLPKGYPYLAPVASPEHLADKLNDSCLDLLGATDLRFGSHLRERYLRHFQLKDFTKNVTTAFRELGKSLCGADHSPPLASDEPTPTNTGSNNEMEPSLHGISYSHIPDKPISISVYLADQNPGHDRSYGISRMTQVVLESLMRHGRVKLTAISSKTSQQPPANVSAAHILPWGTRSKWMRLLTDHLHPFFHNRNEPADLYYFPKGYLPWWNHPCRPSVVTIHDTIIQYDEDHYPEWRRRREYAYWAKMLKHTLRHADLILTVSESSKQQIQAFMTRHGIPRNDVTVTYEPCVYERLPQPENPIKKPHVIHLASREPHKRTAHLVHWWHEAEKQGRELPALHLIGTVPPEVESLLASAKTIVKRPFLDDSALQAAYQEAMALILPSEIEGFGLPALEAYYLGTPVCYVKGTSVEEVLSVVTTKGGFVLDDDESLFSALDEVMSVSPEEVRKCGLKLRETYAAEKVAERMLSVFLQLKN